MATSALLLVPLPLQQQTCNPLAKLVEHPSRRPYMGFGLAMDPLVGEIISGFQTLDRGSHKELWPWQLINGRVR